MFPSDLLAVIDVGDQLYSYGCNYQCFLYHYVLVNIMHILKIVQKNVLSSDNVCTNLNSAPKRTFLDRKNCCYKQVHVY